MYSARIGGEKERRGFESAFCFLHKSTLCRYSALSWRPILRRRGLVVLTLKKFRLCMNFICWIMWVYLGLISSISIQPPFFVNFTLSPCPNTLSWSSWYVETRCKSCKRLCFAGHGKIVDADRLTVMIAPRKVAQKNEDVNALRPCTLGLVNCRKAENEALNGVIGVSKRAKRRDQKKGKEKRVEKPYPVWKAWPRLPRCIFHVGCVLVWEHLPY